QVEADQLHPLVLEVEQRTVNAALVAIEQVRPGGATVGERTNVARSPVIAPIDPGQATRSNGRRAAAAACLRLADLALEAVGAFVDQPAEALRHHVGAVARDLDVVFLGWFQGEPDRCRRASNDDGRSSNRNQDPMPHPAEPRALPVPPAGSM